MRTSVINGCGHPTKKHYRLGMCQRCWRLEKYGIATCGHNTVATRLDGKCTTCAKGKEKANNIQRRWTARNRVRALLILGGKCVSCGDDNLRVLQIDHIDGLGGTVRKSGTDTAHDVVRGKIGTKELQALCASCHHMKSFATNEFWDEVEAEVRADMGLTS